jgi:integrase/recombinase XerD
VPRYIPLDRLSRLTDHLLAVAADGAWTERRDALALLIGLQGLRVSEVTGLRRCDHDAATAEIHVETLKRGRPRDLPLSADVNDRLAAFAATHDSAWLLPTRRGHRTCHTHLQRLCRRVTTELLGSPFRFHCLRHTAATALYNATKDLLLTGRALGHKDLKSTMIYAESLGSLREHLIC